MFGKFPGLVLGLLDTCEIYHFRNAPPGHSFSGCLFPSFYSLFSSHLGVTLVPDSVFCLWFLSVVPESSFCLLFLSLVFESGFSVLFLSLIHKLYAPSIPWSTIKANETRIFFIVHRSVEKLQ